MNKKIGLSAVMALALVAGGVTNVAAASEGASADTSFGARFDGEHGHMGLGGMVKGFFLKHGQEKEDNDQDSNDREGHDAENEHHHASSTDMGNHHGFGFGMATVTAISGNTITATWAKDATVVWTITTDANTKYTYKGNSVLEVGDRIVVAGHITDNEGPARAINANVIMAVDANIAGLKGTITAVNTSTQTVTVSTKHQGDVQVAVDASTTIASSTNSNGAFADLLIGTKVRVHGLWNSLHTIVTAAKIRIVGHA